MCESVHDEVEVLVIGGGFASLLLGARLREPGIEDIRMVENDGGDFGGTWYWNRYPGAACDTEACGGVSTMFGMQTHGFPNCFIVGLSQVGLSADIPHVLDVQSRHITYILKHAREHQVRTNGSYAPGRHGVLVGPGRSARRGEPPRHRVRVKQSQEDTDEH